MQTAKKKRIPIPSSEAGMLWLWRRITMRQFQSIFYQNQNLFRRLVPAMKKAGII